MQAKSLESTSRRSSLTVGRVSEIKDLEPITVEFNGQRIGIYKYNGNFYAYRNVCPHEGGPVIEGALIFERTNKANIACPWHGIEFDLESGICNATKNLRLSKCNVVVRGDEVVLEEIRNS